MGRKVGRFCFLILFFLLFYAGAGLAEESLNMTLIASEEPLAFDDWEKEIGVQSAPITSPLTSAFQMLLALLCVVALAYLILHKGLGSVLKRQRSGNLMKVKERINLDAKHALFLVEVGGQLVLLSASDGRVNVVMPSVAIHKNATDETQPLSFAAIQNNATLGA